MTDQPLYEYIDLEAYDVVPGTQYRKLLEQLETLRDLNERVIRERDEGHAENERLNEQFDALRRLSTDVRDAWTIQDVTLTPLFDACAALDLFLTGSNPASERDA